MSDRPDRPPVAALVEALGVARHAKIGFAVGIGLAVILYAYRVGELLGPVRATRGSPALFALLAFVLAVSAGALVTALLTARSAVRLLRE